MKKLLYKYLIAPISLSVVIMSSCSKYVDVVPDNVPTIENAFALRAQAEKYLFTCYSYMPKDARFAPNAGHTAGDELIPLETHPEFIDMFNIARGNQNFVNPIGGSYWGNMYMAIRDCNIFLENIYSVPDMQSLEKMQWAAEARFLKAYYQFYLVKMYGPVPLVKTNLPIDAPIEDTKVSRNTVDECFDYIVELLDQAKDSLPNEISRQDMLGRISKPVAYALKAKVMVTAASPLYNGNTDQAGLKNNDGTVLFNQTADNNKWSEAATACKEAIDLCEGLGYQLYEAPVSDKGVTFTPAIHTQLSIRRGFTEAWNDEIIWGNTQSWFDLEQARVSPKWDHAHPDNTAAWDVMNAPIKIAEMFYTKNGVPIDEDKTWNYNGRYNLRTAVAAENLLIREGYSTINMHFDREPRFYADLGFDGGVWYGQGRYNDKAPMELFYLASKKGQPNGLSNPGYGPVTGYSIKKFVHFENTQGSTTNYSISNFPWPLIRLADLYLLYAEAVNESAGPGAEAYEYLNLVRERAGLPTVQDAWTNFSTNPSKYATQAGLRGIIHRERLIELAFEANRYWDLKRWKEAPQVLSTPLRGWDIFQETAQAYYTPRTLYNQNFTTRDYFWPISEAELERNHNLKQSTGW